MKAAVIENKGILTKAVPTPEPGPGHVRLRIKAISIRGSAINRYVDGHRMDPLILGHENSRVIALTEPNKAAQFVDSTGIDTLAGSFGRVHGLKAKQISLNLECLKAIRSLVSIPWVLYGSSGVPDDDIKQDIAMGLCNVKAAAQLNQALTAAIRDVLKRDNKIVDPRKYLSLGRNAQVEIVCEQIRILGASGKAQ